MHCASRSIMSEEYIVVVCISLGLETKTPGLGLGLHLRHFGLHYPRHSAVWFSDYVRLACSTCSDVATRVQ